MKLWRGGGGCICWRKHNIPENLRFSGILLKNFMLKSTPMTSKNRSRSSSFELNQDTPEIHPWYKFGPNMTNICGVIVFTSENCLFSCWNRPWPRKIGHGHPSSNLTKTLLGYINAMSLDPMRLIFVELSCLQAKCWRTDGQTHNTPKNVLKQHFLFLHFKV